MTRLWGAPDDVPPIAVKLLLVATCLLWHTAALSQPLTKLAVVLVLPRLTLVTDAFTFSNALAVGLALALRIA